MAFAIMLEIKIPTCRQISTLKKNYSGGLKGVSLYEDRPDGAGEDYFMERAGFYLGVYFRKVAGNSSQKHLSEAINLLMANRLALMELLAENALEEMKEENKNKLHEFLESSERGIGLIDVTSVERTKLLIQQEDLMLMEKPEKIKRPMRYDETREKESRKIWALAKGMQIKKIRDKTDLTIYNVNHYNSIMNVGDETAGKKLNKCLFHALELKKLSDGILKTRGDNLYPITKFWLESRLPLLNQIVEDYFY